MHDHRGSEGRDWRHLAARHDSAPDDDFAGWQEALEAMESDPEERRRAIDADPLLLFRPTASEAEVSPSELEAMKQAVASLRRATAVVHSADEGSAAGVWSFSGPVPSETTPSETTPSGPMQRPRAGVPSRRRPDSPRSLPLRPGSVAAAVAFCASALLLTEVDFGPSPVEVQAMASGTPAIGADELGSPWSLPPASEQGAAARQLPLVEDYGASMDMVMQLDDEALTLVVFSSDAPVGNHSAGSSSAVPAPVAPVAASLVEERAEDATRLGGLEG